MGKDYYWKSVSNAFTDMTLAANDLSSYYKTNDRNEEPLIDFTSFDASHLVCEINNNQSQITVLTDGMLPCV